MSWIFETEPVESDFYVINDEQSADFYIQNEPTENFQTSDHFYILTDIYLETDWYIQNEPTEVSGDEFYIEGEPSETDFYIKDYFEVSNTQFYLAILFDPNEEVAFYFKDYDIVDNTGFITESEYDAGRHDWRSELTNSGEHFIEVSEAIEDLMVDLEDLMLTPEEIQTDQDGWTFVED